MSKLKKKFEKLMSKKFGSITLENNYMLKMNYKSGVISASFDYSVETEGKQLVFALPEDGQLETICKNYIFANKLYDELELNQKYLLIIGDKKSKGMLKDIQNNLEFINNYLFHNRGIKFSVVDLEYLNNLKEISHVNDLMNKLN